VWKETWHVLKPLIEMPFKGGPATWMEDIALELNRRGFFEETHFTIAYSPVLDETAPSGIGGVLATVHEITDKVIGERRVHALRELGARSGEPNQPKKRALLSARQFLLFRKIFHSSFCICSTRRARKPQTSACFSVDSNERACPGSIVLSSQADEIWPLSIAHATEEIQFGQHASRLFPH